MKYLQQRAREWLNEIPEVREEPVLCEYGKRAVWYSGVDGKLNFAWIGIPEGASPDRKVPGIVLVHGGGGTAFAGWADLWEKRGYAVIAMDTCGAFPDTRGQYNNWPRHSYSGPAGWGAYGEQAALPPGDQWFTHAVASVIKATTVLSGLPEVDADRIGMTGISWGSVLSIIAAGLDPRIRAMSAVYGCGFLHEMERAWRPELQAMTEEQRNWWIGEWDPSNFLSGIRCPVQWYAATNDFAFDLPRWNKTACLVPGDRCMKVRWVHGHGIPGEAPREIEAFMNEHLRGGKKRILLTDMQCDGHRISASVSEDKVLAAHLQVAFKSGLWQDSEWITLGAECRNGKISAVLPDGWSAAYLSVVSDDLLFSSSPAALREE